MTGFKYAAWQGLEGACQGQEADTGPAVSALQFNAFELGGPSNRVRLGSPGGLGSLGRRKQQHGREHRPSLASLASLTMSSSARISIAADEELFFRDDALGLEAFGLQPTDLRHAQQAVVDGLLELGRRLDCGKLLLAGAASACVSRTVVAPLERVKMDLVLKSGTGQAWSTAVQVFKKEGIQGFWRGNAVNLVRTAPFKVRAPWRAPGGTDLGAGGDLRSRARALIQRRGAGGGPARRRSAGAGRPPRLWPPPNAGRQLLHVRGLPQNAQPDVRPGRLDAALHGRRMRRSAAGLACRLRPQRRRHSPAGHPLQLCPPARADAPSHSIASPHPPP
jgi:hypothetical protein